MSDPFGGKDPFASASSFDRITDLEGRLLLITPLEYLTGLETEYDKDKDAVDADVVVLDGVPDGGVETFDSMRIYQGPLIGALKRAANFNAQHPVDPATGFPKMVLGRLGQGEAKKKGFNPPWLFLPPTDEDKAVARKYIAEQKRPSDPF